MDTDTTTENGITHDVGTKTVIDVKIDVELAVQLSI